MSAGEVRLGSTAVMLGLLWAFDLFVLGQGLLSVAIAFVGVSALLLGALASLVRGHRAVARRRSLRATIFVALGLAAWGTMRLHAWTGETFAEQIIAACREYEADHGSLPGRLEDLVPDYLPGIPLARISLSYGRFHYSATEDSHLLWYAVVPPALRRSFSFEANRWRQVD